MLKVADEMSPFVTQLQRVWGILDLLVGILLLHRPMRTAGFLLAVFASGIGLYSQLTQAADATQAGIFFAAACLGANAHGQSMTSPRRR